jgi:hypothetical protein
MIISVKLPVKFPTVPRVIAIILSFLFLAYVKSIQCGFNNPWKHSFTATVQKCYKMLGKLRVVTSSSDQTDVDSLYRVDHVLSHLK